MPETKENLLKDKRILKALAMIAKFPGLRSMFKVIGSLLLGRKFKSLSALGKSPEFLSVVKKFSVAEVTMYTRILAPLGFPRLVVKGGRVIKLSVKRDPITTTRTVVGTRGGAETEIRVSKVLQQHIDFLQEESFFQKAHKQAKQQGLIQRSEAAREFYQDYALTYGQNYRSLNMLRSGGVKISNMLLGRMYFFRYSPDEPDSSYDEFPLVFMLYEDQNNFSGINFHYMTPKQRAIILGRTFQFLNNTKYNNKTKLLARKFRNIIQGNKAFRWAKASYRQYRPDQIRSKIIQVHPLDWELAIMVPTERFKTERGGRTSSKKIWFETTKIAKTI